MVRIMTRRHGVLCLLLTILLAAPVQTQQQGETLSVHSYPGTVNVFRYQGHSFVDLQDLARITNGSLSFVGNRITLTFPPGSSTEQPDRDSADQSGFSPAFRRAAIEAMASIREWGGMLKVIVENGYPVGKAMAGNTIRA